MIYESNIGIEIDKEQLTILYLQKFLKRYHVKYYASINLSPYKGERMKEIAQSLKGILKDKKIRDEKVYVGIPRDEVILKFINLPISTEENLREVLGYEMDRHIPFTAEEVYFDYQVIHRDLAKGTIRIMLVAIKKDLLEEYYRVLESIGLKPNGLEISSTALGNALNFCINPMEEVASVAKVGHAFFELDIFHKGNLVYSKFSPFINTDPSLKAEELLRQLELGKKIAMVDTTSLMLCGIRGEESLASSLEEKGKIPVEKLLPIGLNGKIVYRDGSFSIPSMGLALKGFGQMPLRINLIPPEMRKKEKRTRIWTTLVLLILFCLLGISYFSSVVIKDELKLKRLDKTIESLNKEVNSIKTMEREISALEKEIRLLEDEKIKGVSQLETIKELTANISEDTWVNNYVFSDNTIDLGGYSASASKLITHLGSLPLFRNVEFTSPITKDYRSGKEIFRIRIKLEQ